MSLIVKFFTIADEFPCTTTATLLAVSLVGLDSVTGVTVLASSTALPIGVAGDGIGVNTETAGYSADLQINGAGKTAHTQNRVSDPAYNETAGSGKMTVYMSGGRFLTDQYQSTCTFAPGGLLYTDSVGKFTTASSVSRVVGYVAAAPSAYNSGVPGIGGNSPTGGVNGSMSLGTYLDVILSI